MAELIGNDANSISVEKGPRLPVMECGRALVFWLLFGSAISSWSQTRTPAVLIPPADGARANAAQVQAPATGPVTDESSTGTILGVVISKDGEAYEGARISLNETGRRALPVKTETSDADGAFSFTDVPTGTFKLTISSAGFVTQVVSGVLHAGESYDAHSIVLPVVSATSEVRVSAASQEEIAEEQIHEEEHQYVLGVIPNFYVSYVHDAVPLTTKQKYKLAWKSSISPFTWLDTGAIAGFEQAENTYSGYGQGAQGYAKRFGANYADTFIGVMIGNAMLPSILKQDPRYFYKGTGTVRSRVLYAIANAVICKGDNGHWQTNYSSVIGGLAAGGISNLYYPASDRDGARLTFENLFIGFAGSAAQNIFQEFFVRKLTPKLPQFGSSKQ